MIKSDSSTANILLICLDSGNFATFTNYIINEYTGLYTKTPYLHFKDYPNIDYIILTNCSEAHLDPKFNFNVWDAKKYINFVFPANLSEIDKNNKVAEIFDEKVMDFFRYMNDISEDETFGILYLKLLSFIEKEYPYFAVNKTKREYK